MTHLEKMVKKNKNKNKNKITILGIIFLLLIIGGFYAIFFGSEGIDISCKQKEIIGFGKVSPPLLSVATEPSCIVEYEVEFGGEFICGGKEEIFFKKVVRCENLKEYKNKNVTISVTFYDLEGKEIGKDEKVLLNN